MSERARARTQVLSYIHLHFLLLLCKLICLYKVVGVKNLLPRRWRQQGAPRLTPHASGLNHQPCHSCPIRTLELEKARDWLNFTCEALKGFTSTQ